MRRFIIGYDFGEYVGNDRVQYWSEADPHWGKRESAQVMTYQEISNKIKKFNPKCFIAIADADDPLNLL